MATRLISHTVAGAPESVDIPAAVLAAVKTVYPAATVAYPYAELTDISPSLDGAAKTILTLRVTFPSNRAY